MSSPASTASGFAAAIIAPARQFAAGLASMTGAAVAADADALACGAKSVLRHALSKARLAASAVTSAERGDMLVLFMG
jgi:hypothetical protein